MTPTNQPTNCSQCGQRLPQAIRMESIDGRARLFHGDFRDATRLIEPAIDAVITDPPYGSGGFAASELKRPSKAKYVSTGAKYADQMPDIDGDSLLPQQWQRLMTEFLDAAWSVLKDRGILVTFIDWRNLAALHGLILESPFTFRGIAVWNKGNASRPYKNGFRMQAEYLLWATKGKLPDRDPPVYLPGVLSHTTRTNGKRHITEKPERLMEDLVEICPPGGTIFDPFMGSGTTGVAALKTGRRFVGCETVGQYFDVALQRCKEAVNAP